MARTADKIVFEVSWWEFTTSAAARRAADPDTYDHNPDRDQIECVRNFPNVIAARRYARSTARKRSIYASARVTECHEQPSEYLPWIREWVEVGEPEIID